MRRKVSYLVVFLMVLGLVFSVGLFAGGGGEPKGPVTLVVCIRGLDNPYHANYAVGARELGKKLGLPVDVLTSEANSQKQFADLRAEIAKTGGNMVASVRRSPHRQDARGSRRVLGELVEQAAGCEGVGL
jgi:ABC-type sugar transport system substrate-binding protein